MRKKSITFFLVVITAGLLGLVFYVGNMLSSPEPPAATTIRKTKASNITYRDTAQIVDSANNANPDDVPVADITMTPAIEASTPVPTKENGLGGELDPSTQYLMPTDTIPTATSDISATGTEEPSPTEIILAKANTSPVSSTSARSTVAPSKTKMPESGWTEALPTIIALASLIIFVSFLY